MTQWYNGPPGIQAAKTASHRTIFLQRSESFLAQGRIIDGSKSRDPGNTGNATVLRAGTVMGKITSGGKYATSVLGATTIALAANGTTVTTSAAVVTELLRRIGASGTFKLTGPPAASGIVQTLTATYSAASGTTITITALGVNEVQTLDFANSPAGTFTLTVIDLNGVAQTTAPITYSGTAATLVSNINTALNTVLGSSLVVASGSTVTAIALTFSGTGYAALPQKLVIVGSNELTAGTVSVTRTTPGVNGAFVSGSLIQPTDGSENPLLFVPDWEYGIWVQSEDGNDVTSLDFPLMPITGVVDSDQLLPWPADSSLQAWLIDQLSSFAGGKYVFDSTY